MKDPIVDRRKRARLRQMKDNGHPFPSLVEECSFILRFIATSLFLLFGSIAYLLALFGERAREALLLGLLLVLLVAVLIRRFIPEDLRASRSRVSEGVFIGALIVVTLVTTLLAIDYFERDSLAEAFLQLAAGLMVGSILLIFYRSWLTKSPEESPPVNTKRAEIS